MTRGPQIRSRLRQPVIALATGLVIGCGADPTQEAVSARSRVSGVSNSSTQLIAAAATAAAPGSWSATADLPPGDTWDQASQGRSAVLLRDGRLLVQAYENYLYDPAAAIWAKTASMSVPRSGAQLTLLNDGRVLAVGGGSEIAELYNPVTGTWTRTGSMVADRRSHTATLLKNGKVLVVGGMYCERFFCLSPPPAWAAPEELYDPATGKWTQTGSSSRPDGHTATLLNDGRVLVVSFRGAETYDAATGAWSQPGRAPFNPSSHTATLLTDGRVLVVGGSSAALYAPSTGTWILTGGPADPRSGHTATRLAGGNVLVAGGPTECGADPGTPQLNTSEEYDPASGTWSSSASMGTGRYNHTAMLLNDGRVLIAGGIDTVRWTAESCFDPTFTATAEIFAPGSG